MHILPFKISVSSTEKPTQEGSNGEEKGASVLSRQKEKFTGRQKADDKLNQTNGIEEGRSGPLVIPFHLSCIIFRSLRFVVVASLLRKGKKPSPIGI